MSFPAPRGITSSVKLRDRILVITDILVAALYCDGTIMGEEDHAARQLLADLLLTTPDELPPPVLDRIKNFKLYEFELEKAAADFLEDPPMKKRRLLELVVKMIDADGEVDLREDQFVRELASCLGMDASDYEDLVLEIEVEDLPRAERAKRLSESFNALRLPPEPPPIPDDAKRG
ncbi:MAG: hypothetical protein CMH59_21910 [Myxococcales bacterium]|nr:hypothetical protein [Myxococcales bacterium]